LLEAQNIEKEYTTKHLNYRLELTEKNLQEVFNREYREKEKRLVEKWAQQKVHDPLFSKSEIRKNVSRLVRHFLRNQNTDQFTIETTRICLEKGGQCVQRFKEDRTA